MVSSPPSNESGGEGRRARGEEYRRVAGTLQSVEIDLAARIINGTWTKADVREILDAHELLLDENKRLRICLADAEERLKEAKSDLARARSKPRGLNP